MLWHVTCTEKAEEKCVKSSYAIANQGVRIYFDKYARKYKKGHHGEYLVIDVDSEDAYLADTPEEAFRTAKQKHPDGSFYLVRIGFEGVYRVASHSHGQGQVR